MQVQTLTLENNLDGTLTIKEPRPFVVLSVKEYNQSCVMQFSKNCNIEISELNGDVATDDDLRHYFKQTTEYFDKQGSVLDARKNIKGSVKLKVENNLQFMYSSNLNAGPYHDTNPPILIKNFTDKLGSVVCTYDANQKLNVLIYDKFDLLTLAKYSLPIFFDKSCLLSDNFPLEIMLNSTNSIRQFTSFSAKLYEYPTAPFSVNTFPKRKYSVIIAYTDPI